MKKLLLAGLFMLAILLPGAPLTAVKTGDELVIDGKLDDAAWKNALVFDKFFVNGRNGVLSQAASAGLLYSNTGIYIGMKMNVPAGCSVKRNAARGATDTAIYLDDSVEVMIDPSATETRYFHFLANANGATATAVRDQGGAFGAAYNCSFKYKAYAGEGFWSCEWYIPYASLDIQPDDAPWGINICHGMRTPHFQDTSIANGKYHSASDFLKISGFDFDKDRMAWEFSAPEITTAKSGKDLTADISITLGNRSSKKQKVSLNMVMIGKTADGRSAGVTGSSLDAELPPGARQKLRFPTVKLKSPGMFRTIFSLNDPVNRELLKRNTYYKDVTYSPFTIRILEPCYRDMIFASQKLKNAIWSFSANLSPDQLKNVQVVTGIKTADGKVIYSLPVKDFSSKFSYPAAQLPEGKLQIFVKTVKNNVAANEVTRQLWKLPYRKGEVWRDCDGIWHIDDKKFFMIGSWGSHYYPGFSATVSDRSSLGVMRLARQMVYEPRFVALTKVPSITPEDQKHLAGIYRKYSDTPNLFAYYTVDEPELSNCTVMAMKQHYAIAREVDPYHPVMISNDTVKGFEDYAEGAEINGLHPYPPPKKGVPRNEFKRVVQFMEQAQAINRTLEQPQTIAYLQQGFNYGDCGNIGTKVPSYDETRIQYLMAMAMGANAVMFFNFCAEHYYEFSVGHPDIAKELSMLTPAMTVPDEKDKNIVCNNKDIRFRVKKVGNEYWVIACSTVKGRIDAEFTIPALGSRKLQVWREGRTLNAENGTFSDSFNNYDARVYTTDMNTCGLPTLSEVEEKIRQLNETRRKPGNLAFQMLEGDSMKIYASSNKERFPESGLWHVTDGITGGVLAFSGCGYRGKLGWWDNTPGKTPDWIVLEFPKTVKAGRIVVYPAEGTLKDYEVQVEKDGRFVTVGSAKNISAKWDEYQEFKFDPVETRRVRLYVTANNGDPAQARTKVHEIEVYEK